MSKFRDSRGEPLQAGDKIVCTLMCGRTAHAYKAEILDFTPKMIRVETEEVSYPRLPSKGYRLGPVDYNAKPNINKTMRLISNKWGIIKL